MFSEIKDKLNLANIALFTMEECEDRLMLIRYLLRREDNTTVLEEFNPYIVEIEQRIKLLKLKPLEL